MRSFEVGTGAMPYVSSMTFSRMPFRALCPSEHSSSPARAKFRRSPKPRSACAFRGVISTTSEVRAMTEAGAAGASEGAYRTGAEPTVQIAVTTGNDVAGYRVTHYLGIVRGIVVRSPSIGQGIVGAFKQLAGGNISEYVEVCEAARHEAYVQMMDHAAQLGAHAIIGMR